MGSSTEVSSPTLITRGINAQFVKDIIVKPSEMLFWLCPLLSFHMILFSLLRVAPFLLRKTSVVVWTHQSALDIDRIPYIEVGSLHCQHRDPVVTCIIDSGRGSS